MSDMGKYTSSSFFLLIKLPRPSGSFILLHRPSQAPPPQNLPVKRVLPPQYGESPVSSVAFDLLFVYPLYEMDLAFSEEFVIFQRVYRFVTLPVTILGRSHDNFEGDEHLRVEQYYRTAHRSVE